MTINDVEVTKFGVLSYLGSVIQRDHGIKHDIDDAIEIR